MAGYRRPGKADLSLVKGELRREPGSAKFNGVGGVEEKTNDQKRTWHLEHEMVTMGCWGEGGVRSLLGSFFCLS